MRSAIKRILTTAAVVAVTATGALAEDRTKAMEHKFEKAADYYAECQGASKGDFAKIKSQLKAFTDVEIMAETMNDPEKLAALSAVVNDPHTIHVMTSCATEPVMWDTWMRNGTDINKMAAAMTKMMNPVGMMKWMMAPMNPKIWQAMMAHMSPEKYTKWTVAMANPTFYQPVTNLADAKWYGPRINWMSDPKSFAPMFAMFTSFTQPDTGQPQQ